MFFCIVTEYSIPFSLNFASTKFRDFRDFEKMIFREISYSRNLVRIRYTEYITARVN